MNTTVISDVSQWLRTFGIPLLESMYIANTIVNNPVTFVYDREKNRYKYNNNCFKILKSLDISDDLIDEITYK